MCTSDLCFKQFTDDNRFRLDRETLRNYRATISQLVVFCNKSCKDITTGDIRKWLLYIEEICNKPSTIKKKLIHLRNFFQYCLEENMVTHNPVTSIVLPKVEDRLPYYLTFDQVTELRLSEGRLKQRAIIEVLYSTGVRVGELITMKLEDINWEERMIRIPKGKSKKERIVMFTQECAEHLHAYLNNRQDDLSYVFVNGNGTSSLPDCTIRYWFRNYKEKLGYYMSPHTLRHTFAAHLAIKGMPLEYIQVLLGHGCPEATQIYARLCHTARLQIYDEWM